MDNESAVEAFAALAQPLRLAILRRLIAAGPAGLAAGSVATALQQRQNTTSGNLAVLCRAGLIEVERQGRSMVYRAKLDRIGDLVGFLLEDCCGGRPEVCAPVLRRLAPATAGAAGCC